jgi:hypothetical protein
LIAVFPARVALFLRYIVKVERGEILDREHLWRRGGKRGNDLI